MSTNRAQGISKKATTAAAAALALAIALCWQAPALAAPGDLDGRFSRDGKVTVGFGPRAKAASPAEIARAHGGKLVIAALVKHEDKRNRIGVVRLTPVGRRDRSFSGDGRALIDLGKDIRVSAGIAVQGDGRIVIGSTFRGDFIVGRITERGKLDGSFSTDGKATADFGRTDEAHALAIQPDDKILVAGEAVVGSGGPYGLGDHDFALARLNADGSLDEGFGVAGLVTSGFHDYPGSAYRAGSIRAVS